MHQYVIDDDNKVTDSLVMIQSIGGLPVNLIKTGDYGYIKKLIINPISDLKFTDRPIIQYVE